MNPDTGETFDLRQTEEWQRALKKMRAGEISELREVEAEEIERLQAMNREERRAWLRSRPKVERRALEDLLKKEEEADAGP